VFATRSEGLPAYLPGRDETKVSFAIRIRSRRVIATKVRERIDASIFVAVMPALSQINAELRVKFSRASRQAACSIVVYRAMQRIPIGIYIAV